MTDIKSEIGPLAVKTEPKWEMEIEVLTNDNGITPNNEDLKDIVIANTVIRKVEPNSINNDKNDFFNDQEVDVSWKTNKSYASDDIDVSIILSHTF